VVWRIVGGARPRRARVRAAATLALLTLCGVVATVALPRTPPNATTADPRPNIVFILADDMRFDQLDTMPTVQAELVAKGTSFERAFTAGPICCPSRGSFLRGQYVHTHTMYETLATTSPFYK
jgi:hypothetical protein